MILSLEDLVMFRSISIVLILYTGVNGFGPKSVRRAPNQWFERIMWINVHVFKNQKFSENDHTKLAWNQDFDRGNQFFLDI